MIVDLLCHCDITEEIDTIYRIYALDYKYFEFTFSREFIEELPISMKLYEEIKLALNYWTG